VRRGKRWEGLGNHSPNNERKKKENWRREEAIHESEKSTSFFSGETWNSDRVLGVGRGEEEKLKV